VSIIGTGELYDPSGDSPSIATGHGHPIAYAYEAVLHCPWCAAKRFGVDDNGWIPGSARDGEGNEVGAVAPWDELEADETCDDCLESL